MNRVKVLVLLFILTVVFLLLGACLFRHVGFIAALFIMLIVDVGAYFSAPKGILRFYHALPIGAADAARLEPQLKLLADKLRLPLPKIYVIEADAPNAFSVGKNPADASIAVTTGLIQLLNDDEIEAIFAHEMSLIQCEDTFSNGVVASVAGTICNLAILSVWESLFGVKDTEAETKTSKIMMQIVGPISAVLVRAMIYKKRILSADQAAIALLGNTASLVSALEKVNAKVETLFLIAETRPATAHLFFANPLRSEKLRRWFDTFPTMEERIAQIKKETQ